MRKLSWTILLLVLSLTLAGCAQQIDDRETSILKITNLVKKNSWAIEEFTKVINGLTDGTVPCSDLLGVIALLKQSAEDISEYKDRIHRTFLPSFELKVESTELLVSYLPNSII